MQCPQCRVQSPPGTKFCGQCGSPLAVVCRCGAINAPENNFCVQCAAPLGKSDLAHFNSPDAYTPRRLAEKIRLSKRALEGERKQVTVLFADLKGSMELLAERDPEEARKILDPILELMMEAVHRYDGTVNQVLGDGIMALFGAPVALEDHAIRAGYAALRMQEAVAAVAQKLKALHAVDPQIRVGLNSGEVVVRGIGNDLTMDYSAVGQTTHLAARMEQLAQPGTIFVTETFARLTAGHFHFKPLGLTAIKGLAEPVDVLHLVDAEPTHSRFQAASGRGLTRFVGRQAEMDVLRLALDRTRDGHGQAVAVIGEPGTGKSRLLYEFLDSELPREWRKLETAAVSYDTGTVFASIRDLLKAYFQIEERDDPKKIEDKLSRRIVALGEGMQGVLPAFRSLLDVPVDDQGWARLEASQRRQHIIDSVKRLLIRQSQVQPLVLAFENLHWIDAQSEAFLDSLVESLPTARILLIVNYRPEHQHKWGNKTYYTQLRLDPLPHDSADVLLRVLLGDDPSLQPLKQLLIHRTEGNPLFLEESVRHLVETNVLVGEWGTRRVVKAPAAIQVPPTVKAILAARIDRLPPDEKRLLQSSAVIGQDVPQALLEAIAEQSEDSLRTGLAHLRAAEFLYETKLFPDPEYTFKHALTHEVAYGSLLQETRRALHLRIMAAIERVYHERLPEHVERLADHAFRGEAWAKAVEYLRQASTRAVARSAHREAVTYLEQALSALQQLPETRDTREQAVDVRLALRTSLYALGEIRRGLDYLREAEQVARQLDDPRRLGLVLAYIGVNTWTTGDALAARGFAEKALAIADTLGDFPLMVMANFYLGSDNLVLGDLEHAGAFLRKTIALIEGRPSERFVMAGFPAVMARGWLAWVLADRGEFEDGMRVGDEALRMAEAFGQPFSLGRTLTDVGYLHCVQGDAGRAIPLLERALGLWRQWSLLLVSPITSGILGYAYALSGRVADGVSLLNEAQAKGESLELRWPHVLHDIYLAEAHLLADRVDDAFDPAGRALALARERHQRSYEARALRVLGEIAVHRDPPEAETADQFYREAMGLAEALGMRPLIAHCHLGFGALYRRIGKGRESQHHLMMAAAMYQEMGMQRWLTQAESETRERS